MDTSVVREAARTLRDSNPFRLTRRPSLVAFGTAAQEVEVVPEVTETPVFRPQLRLGGILGGPPWSAIIEGIPGREPGILLMPDEEYEGYRLEEVRPDTVIVSAPDTTYTLVIARPWN